MRELPKGWVEAAINDISDVILGQSPPSSSYNTAGTGLPFFQGKAEFGELHPVTARWSVAGAKRARLGDVLISVRAPVGLTNLASEDCIIGRGLAAVRPTPRHLPATCYGSSAPQLISSGRRQRVPPLKPSQATSSGTT